MGKKKAAGKLAAGARVRVKPGVAMPEFPELDCGGWTGIVSEVSGKGADARYVIEWDESVVSAMPASYISQCEARQFYYRMACFRGEAIEAAE